MQFDPSLIDDPESVDDLSDIDLDHPNFRAAFPSGKVPIRYAVMPSLYDGDVTEYLSRASDALGVLDGYPVDELAELAEQFLAFELDGGDKNIAAANASHQARRVLLGKLMSAGLTLRQIARYTRVCESEVAVAATTSAQRMRYRAILLADEVLASGGYSRASLMRDHGLAADVLDGLKRLRSGGTYARVPRSRVVAA